MNIKQALHYGLVGLGYVAGAASFINEVGKDVIDVGVPLPAWARIAIPAAGVLAIRLSQYLPVPGQLTPTPVNANDGDGPAVGKASGEAGLAASKGPFKS
jgi:hypothetical protein